MSFLSVSLHHHTYLGFHAETIEEHHVWRPDGTDELELFFKGLEVDEDWVEDLDGHFMSVVFTLIDDRQLALVNLVI